jgi:hypothetical protein
MPVLVLVMSMTLAYLASHLMALTYDGARGRITFYVMAGSAILYFLLLAVLLSGWWTVLAVAALVALAPWPAPWRAEAEYRGYAMTIAWRYWRSGGVGDDLIAHISTHFTGFNYYRMDPSKDKVYRTLNAVVSDLKSGLFLERKDSAPYKLVYKFLKDRALTNA